MKSKLDHIGVAVRSLEEAVAAYRLFGLELRHTHVNEERGVKVGFLPVGGEAFPGGDGPQIEFIESLGPETNIARFIERRGEGLHHICLEVDDIRAALAYASASLRAEEIRLTA